MEASKLQDHMAGTYFSLRWGMTVIAFGFPLVLWIGGLLLSQGGLLDSLSAYYYTALRDVFVGLLVAIGACLYLYKGFSTAENIALNLAGIFVASVALFPTEVNCGKSCTPVTTHRVVAVLFFLCIAYVAIFRGPDTLSLVEDEKARRNYRATYRTLGLLMIVSPAIALIASIVFEASTGRKYIVVFAEWLAIWIFAAYWFFKSREMELSNAEILALSEAVHTVPPPEAQSRIRRVFSSRAVTRS